MSDTNLEICGEQIWLSCQRQGIESNNLNNKTNFKEASINRMTYKNTINYVANLLQYYNIQET
jgi:hypothetical protein